MDAVTFVKERKRMCEAHTICIGCPLRKFDDCNLVIPEELVKEVEAWSKEHPIKTNGGVMMEKLPECALVDDIVSPIHIYIDRDWWDAEYKGEE